MKGDNSGLLEIMCTTVELKEKMKDLYTQAAGKCSDKVGAQTFDMLREMEQQHLDRLREIYADLSKGGGEVDSCRFYNFEALRKSDVMKRIGRRRETISKACLDDVAAIESGMELENRSIDFFLEQLKKAPGPVEREFLNHMIAEERAHYIVLADLRFYYVDTEHWFMEKGRTELDGAGGMS
ncbi:MAG: hypothetical protein AB9866_03410 [Syntrophobacteraceae bacterium]